MTWAGPLGWKLSVFFFTNFLATEKSSNNCHIIIHEIRYYVCLAFLLFVSIGYRSSLNERLILPLHDLHLNDLWASIFTDDCEHGYKQPSLIKRRSTAASPLITIRWHGVCLQQLNLTLMAETRSVSRAATRASACFFWTCNCFVR
jgi:hypothetical protein